MSETPPALIAEATKRAGLIWITTGERDRPRPAWHIWRSGPGLPPPGAAYVVTGPGEQPLPGLAEPGRVTVTVAGSPAAGPPGARGSVVTWAATVSKVEPGSAEWDEVIGELVAGRLNAVLAGTQTSPAQRWARSGAVFRLAPVRPAQNALTVLSAAPPAVHPTRRLAGHRQRRNSHQCGGS